MAQFASADDLAAQLGIELTENEESRADALLSLASGLIQDAARQTIELVENETVVMRRARGAVVLLAERPVVSVSSVLAGGDALAADTYYLDGDCLVRSGGTWGDLLGVGFSGNDELVVTYTHGYEEIPETIKGICVAAVVRAWVNPGAVAQEGYGSERVVYPVQGMLLTAQERRALRKVTGRRSEPSAVQ